MVHAPNGFRDTNPDYSKDQERKQDSAKWGVRRRNRGAGSLEKDKGSNNHETHIRSRVLVEG